jgi:hypothetical protein
MRVPGIYAGLMELRVVHWLLTLIIKMNDYRHQSVGLNPLRLQFLKRWMLLTWVVMTG